MAWLYHDLIKKGKRTFNDIPKQAWKDEVKAMFRQDVVDHNITPEQYEEYVGEPYEE